MFDVDPIYFIVTPPMLNSVDYGLFALLGVAAAGVGVIVMRAATTFEAPAEARATFPIWLRPAMGGLVLAAIGYFYPQVLGSGHGALDATLNGNVAIQLLLALLAAKALASAISIGSGFRGGLFSASLLLGSLLGSAYLEHLLLSVSRPISRSIRPMRWSASARWRPRSSARR